MDWLAWALELLVSYCLVREWNLFWRVVGFHKVYISYWTEFVDVTSPYFRIREELKLCVGLWQCVVVLGWPCAVDKTLKLNSWLNLRDGIPCHIHLSACLWIMDPHGRALTKNTSHENVVLPQDTTHLIGRPCYQRGSPWEDPAGNPTTRRSPDRRKKMQTAVIWSCLPFIRSGQNRVARHSERGKNLVS